MLSTATNAICLHENVTKLAFLDYKYPSIHGPRTEVWRVKCDCCNEELTEDFIGD